jgi:hypothetical protein
LKAKLRKMLKPKPDFSNPFSFSEARTGYYIADKNSLSKIFSENWVEHAEKRRENWIAWSTFAKNNKLCPIWDTPHPESCPWLFPVFAPNHEVKIFWLHWGWQKGIDVNFWPTLPKIILEKKTIAYKRWKLLICFPLHHSPVGDAIPQTKNNKNK